MGRKNTVIVEDGFILNFDMCYPHFCLFFQTIQWTSLELLFLQLSSSLLLQEFLYLQKEQLN